MKSSRWPTGLQRWAPPFRLQLQPCFGHPTSHSVNVTQVLAGLPVFGAEIDVWSVGVVLAEVRSVARAFAASNSPSHQAW